MDPDQTLTDLRDISAKMAEGMYVPALMAAAHELMEKFQALDEWMSKGGFAPKDWSR